MGCGPSQFETETIRTAVRRLQSSVAVDLEPLVLNDPGARRAVLDFVRADKNCSGGLTPDEFAHTFSLSADTFLGCVIGDMDGSNDGSVDLREFLVGVSQFTSSSREEMVVRQREFAFDMMDVSGRGAVDKVNLKQFATLAYEQFGSNATRGKLMRENSWGDAQGRHDRAARDLRSCHKTIDALCPFETVTYQQFERLAMDMPLILAPAVLVWTTFEHLAPASASVCNAMVARGHRSFTVKRGQRRSASMIGNEAQDSPVPSNALKAQPGDRRRPVQPAAPVQRAVASGNERAPRIEQPRGAYYGASMDYGDDGRMHVAGAFRQGKATGAHQLRPQPARYNNPRAEDAVNEGDWGYDAPPQARPPQGRPRNGGYDGAPARQDNRGYDAYGGYDSYNVPPVRQVGPPRGQPGRNGPPGQMYDEAEYWDDDDAGAGAMRGARSVPAAYAGGDVPRTSGGQNAGDVMSDIMMELQAQKQNRKAGMSNLQAAQRVSGGGPAGYSGYPG